MHFMGAVGYSRMPGAAYALFPWLQFGVGPCRPRTGRIPDDAALPPQRRPLATDPAVDLVGTGGGMPINRGFGISRSEERRVGEVSRRGSRRDGCIGRRRTESERAEGVLVCKLER